MLLMGWRRWRFSEFFLYLALPLLPCGSEEWLLMPWFAIVIERPLPACSDILILQSRQRSVRACVCCVA